MLEDMPDEILLTVFTYLDLQQLNALRAASKRLKAIAEDPTLWGNFYEVNASLKDEFNANYIGLYFFSYLFKKGKMHAKEDAIRYLNELIGGIEKKSELYFAYGEATTHLLKISGYKKSRRSINWVETETIIEPIGAIDILEQSLTFYAKAAHAGHHGAVTRLFNFLDENFLFAQNDRNKGYKQLVERIPDILISACDKNAEACYQLSLYYAGMKSNFILLNKERAKELLFTAIELDRSLNQDPKKFLHLLKKCSFEDRDAFSNFQKLGNHLDSLKRAKELGIIEADYHLAKIYLGKWGKNPFIDVEAGMRCLKNLANSTRVNKEYKAKAHKALFSLRFFQCFTLQYKTPLPEELSDKLDINIDNRGLFARTWEKLQGLVFSAPRAGTNNQPMYHRRKQINAYLEADDKSLQETQELSKPLESDTFIMK